MTDAEQYLRHATLCLQKAQAWADRAEWWLNHAEAELLKAEAKANRG